MKQIIRLTESDLHRIVKESVKKIIKEYGEFGGPDADPHDLYPDMYPPTEDENGIPLGDEGQEDYLGNTV